MLTRNFIPPLFVLGILAAPAAAQCPPAAPGGVAASNGTQCNGVLIDWNAVTGATYYEVWRSTSSGSNGTHLIDLPFTQYTDLTALPGNLQHYWYRVRAVRSVCLPPTGTGPFGGPNEGWRGDTPGTPTNVQASDGTVCVGVQVTWDDVPGTPIYKIFRNEVNNYASSYLVGSTPLTNLTDLNAVAGYTHYYWVRADAACGSSSASEPDSGFVGTAPGIPTGFDASYGECAGVTIGWDPLPGTVTRIYRNDEPVLATAELVGVTPLSTWVDEPPSLVEYYYWAQRQAPCGLSEYAGPVIGRMGSVQAAPELFSPSYGYPCNSIQLSWYSTWPHPPAATAWRVYRSEVDKFSSSELIGTTEETDYLDEDRTPGRTYFYWVKAENNCGLSDPSEPVDFTISTDPFVITEQPHSQSVAVGGVALLSVETTGPGVPQYQWFHDGVAVQNGGGYQGAMWSTLVVHPATLAHAGTYRVEVSTGCTIRTSDPATLTVVTPCYADCDHSGGLNISDYICFQTKFALGDPYADCDGNGQLNVNDFICFQTKFALGC